MQISNMQDQWKIAAHGLDRIELPFLSRCAWDWVVELPPSNFAGNKIGLDPQEVAMCARINLDEITGGAFNDFWIVSGDQDGGGVRLTALLSTPGSGLDREDIKSAWGWASDVRLWVRPYAQCRGLWYWISADADVYDCGGSALSSEAFIALEEADRERVAA